MADDINFLVKLPMYVVVPYKTEDKKDEVFYEKLMLNDIVRWFSPEIPIHYVYQLLALSPIQFCNMLNGNEYFIEKRSSDNYSRLRTSLENEFIMYRAYGQNFFRNETIFQGTDIDTLLSEGIIISINEKNYILPRKCITVHYIDLMDWLSHNENYTFLYDYRRHAYEASEHQHEALIEENVNLKARIDELIAEKSRLMEKIADLEAAVPSNEPTIGVNASRWKASVEAALNLYVQLLCSPDKVIKKADFSTRLQELAGSTLTLTEVETLAWRIYPADYKFKVGRPGNNTGE